MSYDNIESLSSHIVSGKEAMHDWHYFFHHVPHNLSKSTYRIFEPQWKAEILHWFGREDVGKEQKEEFIKALIDFDDGCGDFYRYRAYFLASEALSQFQDCSLGDTIVAQLLKWSYAYFRQDKSDWKIFPQPLVKTARAGLEATDRERAIAAFVKMVHTTESRSTLRLAAQRLGQLDPGNRTAIAALLLLMQQDEGESHKAAPSLGKIASGNETAIAATVHLMETTLNKHICWDAIAALREIGYGNQTAIAALVRFLQTNQGDNICFDAADALWKIDPGNVAVFDTLVLILETTQNSSLLVRAAAYLVQIHSGNTPAVSEAMPKAVAALCERIESTQNERTRLRIAESLLQIDSGNSCAIATLSQLLETTQNERIRLRIAESLVQIEAGNSCANEVIATLVRFIQTFQEDDDHQANFAENCLYYESCLLGIADSLRGILHDHLPQVVIALKDYLGEQFYKNSSYRYEAVFSIIWHCAQNMTYPEFYTAWHNTTGELPLPLLSCG